jgi:IS5 family transposase
MQGPSKDAHLVVQICVRQIRVPREGGARERARLALLRDGCEQIEGVRRWGQVHHPEHQPQLRRQRALRRERRHELQIRQAREEGLERVFLRTGSRSHHATGGL